MKIISVGSSSVVREFFDMQIAVRNRLFTLTLERVNGVFRDYKSVRTAQLVYFYFKDSTKKRHYKILTGFISKNKNNKL